MKITNAGSWLKMNQWGSTHRYVPACASTMPLVDSDPACITTATTASPSAIS